MPAGIILSLSMFVGYNTSEISSTSPVKYSIKPLRRSNPKVFNTLGFSTSASTRSTVLSCSEAILMAKFVAVNVFPSEGRLLVTIIILGLCRVFASEPKALAKSLRLISRYSSFICFRSPFKEICPFLSSLSKFIVNSSSGDFLLINSFSSTTTLSAGIFEDVGISIETSDSSDWLETCVSSNVPSAISFCLAAFASFCF